MARKTEVLETPETPEITIKPEKKKKERTTVQENRPKKKKERITVQENRPKKKKEPVKMHWYELILGRSKK